MAPDTDSLPRFHNPPIDEVAVGAQFSLPGFLPTHYGGFHEYVRAEYPRVQVLPALPPMAETFSIPQGTDPSARYPALVSFGMPPLPRVLFISDDDSSLIQLQSDRLYFNWRRRAQNSYPHYEHFRVRFARAFAALEVFAADQHIGPVVPTQCDVLYVNPLPQGVTGAAPSSPEAVFRCWDANIGEEWRTPLEDLSFNARYRLLDAAGQPYGRLTVTMSTGVAQSGTEQMRLELAARGAPRGPGLDGVLAFHDDGHEAIVRCFAAITTREMHDRWGRYGHE